MLFISIGGQKILREIRRWFSAHRSPRARREKRLAVAITLIQINSPMERTVLGIELRGQGGGRCHFISPLARSVVLAKRIGYAGRWTRCSNWFDRYRLARDRTSIRSRFNCSNYRTEDTHKSYIQHIYTQHNRSTNHIHRSQRARRRRFEKAHTIETEREWKTHLIILTCVYVWLITRRLADLRSGRSWLSTRDGRARHAWMEMGWNALN